MKDKPSKTAVVVNDNLTQLDVLSGLVKKAGLKAECFSGAEEALKNMNPDAPPDIIITDLYMPDIDGWKFCRLLRSAEYPALNQIPVLVVSATYGGDEADRIAADIGADAFLSSPVDGKTFVEQLNSLLQGEHRRIPKKILIVEDSRTQSAKLEKIFTDQGYQVSAAHSVKEAFDTFAEASFDEALIDYHLPDGTGCAVLEKIREQKPDCVCVMMTADPDPLLALRWMKQGAAAYVRKPFEPRYILEVCARARRERALLRVENLLEKRTLELRQSKDTLTSLLESLPVGIIRARQDGSIVLANKAMAKMHGYPNINEFLIKKSFEHYADSEKRAALARDLEKYGLIENREELFKRKDGSVFPGIVTVRAFRDSDGKILYYDGSVIDITERKKDEQTLQESRELLAQSQEIAHMGSWILEPSSGSLTWSDEVYRMFGMKSGHAEGSYEMFIQSVHPDDREKVDSAFYRSIEEGQEGYEIEHRIIRNDTGEIRAVHERCVHERGEDGNVIRSIGMIQDITQRKKAEEELMMKSLVLDQIKDYVTITDLNGVIQYVNQAEIETFGTDEEKLVGQKTDVYGEDSEQGAAQKEILENTLNHGTWRGEVVNFTHDGRRIILDCRTQLVYNTDGAPVAVCGISTNITERKQIDKKLAESEARYKLLAETTGDIIVLHDSDGIITYINNAGLDFLGLKEEEITGKNICYFLSEEEQLKSKERKKQRTKGDAGRFCYETFFVNRKGKKITVEICSTPIHEESGRFSVLLVARDITGRKLAEEKLRKSEELFNKALSVIPDMISIHDTEMNILYSNWNGFASVPEEKRLYRTKCYKTYRDFDSICPDCRANTVLETGKAVNEETQLPDGTWVELRVIPLLGSAESVEMFVEWVRDITANKKAENELAASMEEVKRFNAFMVGRELRMIDLKKEINALLNRLDEAPKYPGVFQEK